MQNAQCKLCPNCGSVQALDSRYCSQCSNALDESTYAALSKHKNTILITALATLCAFLAIVLFAVTGGKPSARSLVPETANTPTNGIPANGTPPGSATINAVNSAPTKTIPKQTPSPTPAEKITAEVPDQSTTAPSTDDRTESKRENDARSSESADRDAYPSRDYQTGPRGGCFYLSGSGSKVYVDRSFCGNRSSPNPRPQGYIRGPRGGCYYINGSGNKTYVDRSLCN
jgi:hypothetical protein